MIKKIRKWLCKHNFHKWSSDGISKPIPSINRCVEIYEETKIWPNVGRLYYYRCTRKGCKETKVEYRSL